METGEEAPDNSGTHSKTPAFKNKEEFMKNWVFLLKFGKIIYKQNKNIQNMTKYLMNPEISSN